MAGKARFGKHSSIEVKRPNVFQLPNCKQPTPSTHTHAHAHAHRLVLMFTPNKSLPMLIICVFAGPEHWRESNHERKYIPDRNASAVAFQDPLPEIELRP